MHGRNKSEVERETYSQNKEDSEDQMQQVIQQFVKAIDENATNNVIYGHKVTDVTAFMFPHAGFVDVLCQLGFDRNDGIINLMPIVTYCTDE